MKSIALLFPALLCTFLASGCNKPLGVGTFCETPAGATPHMCSSFTAQELVPCGGGTVMVESCPTTNELGTCSNTSSIEGLEVVSAA